MDITDIKTIVRSIRMGDPVLGAVLIGDSNKQQLLNYDGHSYEVYGRDRLRIVEKAFVEFKESDIEPESTPEPKIEEPSIIEIIKRSNSVEAICDQCGNLFVRSKFSPYIIHCEACRKHVKIDTSKSDRMFVCETCGITFYVSKFQPYLNPTKCKKCRKI